MVKAANRVAANKAVVVAVSKVVVVARVVAAAKVKGKAVSVDAEATANCQAVNT